MHESACRQISRDPIYVHSTHSFQSELELIPLLQNDKGSMLLQQLKYAIGDCAPWGGALIYSQPGYQRVLTSMRRIFFLEDSHWDASHVNTFPKTETFWVVSCRSQRKLGVAENLDVLRRIDV